MGKDIRKNNENPVEGGLFILLDQTIARSGTLRVSSIVLF